MKQPGFTLIEVAAVTGVIVLLSLITLPAFRNRQQNVNLDGNGRTLLSTLRLANQLTVAQQTTHLVKLYSTSPNRYELIRREASDTVVLSRQLTTGITWQDISNFTNNEIVFTITGAVVQAGTIVLQNTQSKTRTIDIKPSGYVKFY